MQTERVGSPIILIELIMNLKKIREHSLLTAESLGYHTSADLPLLDDGVTLRPVEEFVGRSLALFATVAASYGFDKNRALSWLEGENLSIYLAESEKKFLINDEGDRCHIQSQVEGLNAFAWSLGIVNHLAFDRVCENNLIKHFPDIKNNGGSLAYRAKSELRSLRKIVQSCDLAYCLHWAVVQAQIEKKELPGDVRPHVIIERRRALEWMLGKDDWDEVSLDT